jgi:predicted nucleic acid-binding protein
MKVIVDTSIWSLALRRDGQYENKFVQEFRNLIHNHLVQILGPIRQEILSGIRHEPQFNRLKKRLDSFPDFSVLTEDYVSAAKFFNICRSKGVQGSNTDFLICSVAVRSKSSIFTADDDFELFAQYLPTTLYPPPNVA